MDPAAALATTPAALPPPGQFTNFVDPPSQQAVIIGVSVMMMVLTLLFVSLRLYSTLYITRSRGLEDYLCLLAMILSFTYSGFTFNLSFAARHLWDVPEIWFTENYWKLRYAQNMVQAFAFFTSRLPIFFLYLRLFGPNRPFRLAVYFGMAAAFAIYMSAVPLLSYYCTPLPGKPWSSLDVFTKCKKLVIYAVIQGSFNIALDLYIFTLPLPTIFGLHLPLKRRLGVLAIFGTGFFAVIASVISLFYRYQLSYGTDINWNEGAYIAAASVELNIAIICSSMPACSSLAKHVFADSNVFGSVRSLLNRLTPSMRTKNSNSKSSNSKRSQSLYDGSYPSGIKPNDHSMDSRAPLPQNGYMELQDTKPLMRTNAANAADCYYQDPRSPENQPGITRTIEVNVV